MTCPSADFRAAMRGLASGVSLVTTRDLSGASHGMAATAVMSVSAEPPRLLICVNKAASMHDPLVASGYFAVNFLAAEQAAMVGLFSSAQKRHLRFADSRWTKLETGAPVLEGAVATLDCRVVQRIDAETHSMFLGDVVATLSTADARAPLLHYHGGLGGFAAAA